MITTSWICSGAEKALGGLVIDNNEAFFRDAHRKDIDGLIDDAVTYYIHLLHPCRRLGVPSESFFVFLSAFTTLVMDKVELEGVIHHQINPRYSVDFAHF